MNYNLLYIAGIILCLILLIFILRMIIKRRRAKKNEIPKDVLELFELAERRLKESNGTANPYTILWEIAKGNRTGEYVNNSGLKQQGTRATEQATSSTELDKQPIRREDIQARVDTINRQDNRSLEQLNTQSNRNFFSRFRRK